MNLVGLDVRSELELGEPPQYPPHLRRYQQYFRGPFQRVQK